MYANTHDFMKWTRYAVMLLALSAVFFSCKKEEETELSASFSGVLKFSIPAFVTPGEKYDLTPSGVFTADDTPYGYFWTITPTATQRDTLRKPGDPAEVDGTLHFTVPDTLCQLTITCAAFASGYYNSLHTEMPHIISDESLTGIEISSSTGGIFKDPRDNVDYLYNTSSGLDWFCSNLEYASLGRPYVNCEAARPLFGNFYTWEEAVFACPDGWRLPTVDEWKAVCGGYFEGAAGSLMVDAYLNEERMWEYWPEVKITNETLITALPIGYAMVSGEEYSFVGKNAYAAFWTATEFDDDQADYIYINEKTPDVMVASADKAAFATTVRCVR